MKKLKVLLVDDEAIVLEDLKTLIDWEENGIQTLYTARNATQAFRVLQKDAIDVIFMDILLPGTDGLALSKEILDQYPGIHIIILSAYNEFSYATKGIELGVYRYLLKHELNPEKMTSVLSELRRKIDAEESTKIMLQEQILYKFLMNGKTFLHPRGEEAKMLGHRLWMGAIVIMHPITHYLQMERATEPAHGLVEDGLSESGMAAEQAASKNPVLTDPAADKTVVKVSEGRKTPEERRPAGRRQMRVSISELMSLETEGVHAKYILSTEDRLLLFVEENECSFTIFENLLASVAFRLQEKTDSPVKYLYYPYAICVGDLKEYNVKITQGIPGLVFYRYRTSIPVDEILAARSSSEDFESLSGRIISSSQAGPGQAGSGLGDGLEQSYHSSQAEPGQAGRGLRDGLKQSHRSSQTGPGQTGRSLLDGVDWTSSTPQEVLDKVLRSKEEACFFQISKQILDAADTPDLLDGVYYAEEAADILKKQAQELENRKNRDDAVNPITRFILRYIEANYSKNISLQQIAEELNANVMYIGRIFQKDMGVSFRTWLNDFRIRQAQFLLRSTNQKVFEISEEVGIPNTQYFSKIFRQQTGDTPNEYRQKYYMT